METRAPRGLAAAGKRLWSSITGSFDLEAHEALVLEQAARVADRIAALDVVVDREGVVEPGTGRAHPMLVESRAQRLVMARLLSSLRLPDVLDQRPQRRGNVRGFYAVRPASDGG
jgi:hypothetical protein